MARKMNSTQFKKRVATVLRGELDQPERWHYVSFADKVFHGGVIIKAHGITDATMKCNLLGINPGGQVMCFEFPADMPVPDTKWRNRLLSKSDVLEIWPDAKSLGEFEKEANAAEGGAQ